MSGASGMGGATETLLDMIKLFADPDAAKKRVSEYQDAATKAAATVADATARERNARQAEQAAKTQRDELAAAMWRHEQDKTRFEATKAEITGSLSNRETAAKEREQRLDELEKTVRAEIAQKTKILTDRENAVARRERDAETRAIELARRDERIVRRERALEKALAEP